MPNTLAHIAVQGIATRTLWRGADFKWVCLGCVIPDVPWIIQRLALMAWAGHALPYYALRSYVIVQATLAFSLLLCASIAAIATHPKRVFSVLALNAVFHLLLDACETKWGNGVHLLAPFSWRMTNWELVWPESLLIVVASTLGLAVWWRGWRERAQRFKPWRPTRLSWSAGVSFALLYLVGPMAFLSRPEGADNHSMGALRDGENRVGRAVEFDRRPYEQRPSGSVLQTFAREELQLSGYSDPRPGAISVKGRFIDESRVEALSVHRHWPRVREYASASGLALVLLLWVWSAWQWAARNTGSR